MKFKILITTIFNGLAAGSDVLIPPVRSFPHLMSFTKIYSCNILFFNVIHEQLMYVVDLNMTEKVFSRSQLYIGCSRVGSLKNLYIASLKKKGRNVVYQEVLQ